jgi:hypothetical protein
MLTEIETGSLPNAWFVPGISKHRLQRDGRNNTGHKKYWIWTRVFLKGTLTRDFLPPIFDLDPFWNMASRRKSTMKSPIFNDTTAPCATEPDFLIKKTVCRIIREYIRKKLVAQRCQWYFVDYLREFEAIFETASTCESGIQGKLFDEKKQMSKISCQGPFKGGSLKKVTLKNSHIKEIVCETMALTKV